MLIQSLSQTHTPYDMNLDYYHGKDIVHSGCLLKMDPDFVWQNLDPKVRNKIRKAQKVEGIRIERLQGTTKDLEQFRAIWFDPEDITLPTRLAPEEIMFAAFVHQEMIAGLILTPAGANLYMHNLGANEMAKKAAITSLLLWHAVEQLKDGPHKYIDIGVSFRKNLYDFFESWATEKYPIIFNEPFIKPHLSLIPFGSAQVSQFKKSPSAEVKQKVESYFGRPLTIFPRAILCIRALMIHLKISAGDEVAIFKTSNENKYISRCVTDTIEHFGKVSREINSRTKAVMVIHEFGFPYEKLRELKKECEQQGLPLIENCAWTWGSKTLAGDTVGTVGDYAIYSLPKIFPMQYGGVLVGLDVSDAENWSVYRSLDFYKREVVYTQLAQHLEKAGMYNALKIRNINYLLNHFEKDKIHSVFNVREGVYPSGLVLKFSGSEDHFKRYAQFGVETARYYPEDALVVPCHQNLSESELDYIYAVFRGTLNLCSTYSRQSMMKPSIEEEALLPENDL